MRLEITQAVEILKNGDEAALRDFRTPHPNDIEEMNAMIDAVTNRDHDYGTCVYAMSISAEVAFNYVAHVNGCTGFQASCADLDIVRRTRSLKGPFAIIDAHDLLYPQYNIPKRVNELLGQWRPWVKEEAARLLRNRANEECVHPDVRKHWEKLAVT